MHTDSLFLFLIPISVHITVRYSIIYVCINKVTWLMQSGVVLVVMLFNKSHKTSTSGAIMLTFLNTIDRILKMIEYSTQELFLQYLLLWHILNNQLSLTKPNSFIYIFHFQDKCYNLSVKGSNWSANLLYPGFLDTIIKLNKRYHDMS